VLDVATAALQTNIGKDHVDGTAIASEPGVTHPSSSVGSWARSGSVIDMGFLRFLRGLIARIG